MLNDLHVTHGLRFPPPHEAECGESAPRDNLINKYAFREK